MNKFGGFIPDYSGHNCSCIFNLACVIPLPKTLSLLWDLPFQAGPGLQWCQSSLSCSYSTSFLFIQSIIIRRIILVYCRTETEGRYSSFRYKMCSYISMSFWSTLASDHSCYQYSWIVITWQVLSAVVRRSEHVNNHRPLCTASVIWRQRWTGGRPASNHSGSILVLI